MSEKKLNEVTKRLIEFRENQHLNRSQFAKKLNVAISSLDFIEKGERPCSASIKLALLKVYGYDIDTDTHLFASKDAAERVSSDLITIPFYRVSAAAGSGITVPDEPQIDNLYFDKRWLASVIPSTTKFEYLNCITASGDSMITPDNKGIHNGDLLFVDTYQKIVNNGIYVILINNELRVKRLIKLMNGDLSIQSDNPKYPTEVFKPNEDNYTIAIVGKVVYNTSRGDV